MMRRYVSGIALLLLCYAAMGDRRCQGISREIAALGEI